MAAYTDVPPTANAWQLNAFAELNVNEVIEFYPSRWSCSETKQGTVTLRPYSWQVQVLCNGVPGSFGADLYHIEAHQLVRIVWTAANKSMREGDEINASSGGMDVWDEI